MKRLLLNFCLAASICLNACAGVAETIGTGHAFGRKSLTEVGTLMGLGDILSGVLPGARLPELVSEEMQINSWPAMISGSPDELVNTEYRERDSTFGPTSNLILRSRGKPEQRLRVPEPPPYFLVGTGLLGIIVLCKAKSLRERIRIRGAYSDCQTRYW
jgi:hypothetical protein